MFRDMLWVSAGAILGANLRYLMYRWTGRLTTAIAFPAGTLLINIVGSFLLGLFSFYVAARVIADPKWRLFFAVGFCGAFTTFSSFAFDSYGLWLEGRPGTFLGNIVANNLLCIVAVIGGAALAKALP